MSRQIFAGNEERFLRRYEYDEEWVVAADLGVADDAVSVDVVGQTAIVVADVDDEVHEAEFELPGEDAAVSVKNGVLTVRGDRA